MIDTHREQFRKCIEVQKNGRKKRLTSVTSDINVAHILMNSLLVIYLYIYQYLSKKARMNTTLSPVPVGMWPNERFVNFFSIY